MRRHFIALAPALLLGGIATPAVAQTSVIGSGIAPATVKNSEVRPINFALGTANRADNAIAIIMTDAKLPADALDPALRPAVEAAIASAKFEGKAGSSLTLRGIGQHPRIHLVGAGGDAPEMQRYRNAGGKIAQDLKDEAAPISIAGSLGKDAAAEVALGFALGQYRFDRYKTVGKTTPPVTPVSVYSSEGRLANNLFTERHAALAEGVTLSRDLATEPANVIYPESFVAEVRAAFAGVRNV